MNFHDRKGILSDNECESGPAEDHFSNKGCSGKTITPPRLGRAPERRAAILVPKDLPDQSFVSGSRAKSRYGKVMTRQDDQIGYGGKRYRSKGTKDQNERDLAHKRTKRDDYRAERTNSAGRQEMHSKRSKKHGKDPQEGQRQDWVRADGQDIALCGTEGCDNCFHGRKGILRGHTTGNRCGCTRKRDGGKKKKVTFCLEGRQRVNPRDSEKMPNNRPSKKVREAKQDRAKCELDKDSKKAGSNRSLFRTVEDGKPTSLSDIGPSIGSGQQKGPSACNVRNIKSIVQEVKAHLEVRVQNLVQKSCQFILNYVQSENDASKLFPGVSSGLFETELVEWHLEILNTLIEAQVPSSIVDVEVFVKRDDEEFMNFLHGFVEDEVVKCSRSFTRERIRDIDDKIRSVRLRR